MKNLISALLILIATISRSAPSDDYVITVKTSNPGAGTNTSFIIYSGIGLDYDYNVDCDNDDNDEATNQTGTYTCNYPVAGTYTIRIKDNTGTGDGLSGFHLGGTGVSSVAEKLLSVEQWGTAKWKISSPNFFGAINLVINATDVPDFSNVSSMGSMFNGAILANPDTSAWDTSSVTNMNNMFEGAIMANPDTSNWNTSSVTSMTRMFKGAILANPNTSNWDTSSVTLFSRMFEGATMANPDTSNWDISNVTHMIAMFSGVKLPIQSYENMLIGFAAQNLQSDVIFHAGDSIYCSDAAQLARASIIANFNWTITDGGICNPDDDFIIRIKSDAPGGLPTEFLIATFGGGYNYNVDCNNDGEIEAYAQTGDYICDYSNSGAGIYTIRIQDNLGTGTGYSRPMFNSANVREKILSIQQWGSAAWSDMNQAFKDCNALVINATDTPDLSNVSNFRLMFAGASLVNPNTSNWNMSSATDIAGMFRNTNNANPNTSLWDTSSVTDMSFMFDGALAANPDVADWDTSLVTNMDSMFRGAISASPIISGWDVSSVTNMTSMFEDLTLATIEYDAILTNFSVQNLKSNVVFGAGDSQYCSEIAQASRQSLISFNNWSISDGGFCDVVFEDGFESSVAIFKTVDAKFVFDFSKKELLPTDVTPLLIATGYDANNHVNTKVYLRQNNGELQIMQSLLMDDIDNKQVWSNGLWYDVLQQGLSEIVLW